MKVYFENRSDAGKKLVEELKKLNLQAPLILALPRGGVILARELAKFYRTSPDILLVRKMGAPFDKELAIGALVEGHPPQMILNAEMVKVLKLDPHYLESERQAQLKEMHRQDQAYRDGKTRIPVTGKTVVLVDDGIATGASVKAALKAIRNEKPKMLILAVPVAPPEVVAELRPEVDELICLVSPQDFKAVGQYYRDFRQTTDIEVKLMLAESYS